METKDEIISEKIDINNKLSNKEIVIDQLEWKGSENKDTKRSFSFKDSFETMIDASEKDPSDHDLLPSVNNTTSEKASVSSRDTLNAMKDAELDCNYESRRSSSALETMQEECEGDDSDRCIIQMPSLEQFNDENESRNLAVLFLSNSYLKRPSKRF